MHSARWIASLVTAGLCACLRPVWEGDAADAGSAGAGPNAKGPGDAGAVADAGACEGLGCLCLLDSECGTGAVCEPSQAPCDARSKRCVRGCHLDQQCDSGETCAPRLCLTCPCPGACTAAGACYGSPACTTPIDCSPGASTCKTGCCASCPDPGAPSCNQGECKYPGGISPEGCPEQAFCAPCPACPNVEEPACSTRYVTFASPCEAEGVGQGVLHGGPCLPGEGVACGASGECPTGQYCRISCHMCQGTISQTRCTQKGACLSAKDCPAGLAASPCAQGGHWECVNHTCRLSCP